jgi:hypothetical protein
MTHITVESRFCGPPGSANGGYLAGLLAGLAGRVVRVRLERPVPLQVPLQVHTAPSAALELLHHGEVLARARSTTLDLSTPAPPDYLQALDASRRYIGLQKHAFPGCFVCGPDRGRGDGLRIFAGELTGRDQVAATWVPDDSLAAGDGKVRPEFMSAALDCPGYFAARRDGVPMLLGEYSVQVDRCVHIDEPCIIVGWRIGVSGRKYEVGTAMFDEDGEPCARALAVWIEPRVPGSAGTPAELLGA